ncbi:hypothetical protein [Corallococcus llansteffanensis]|uniref:DUF1440 domain-containing protein n=1 Tax=Corallococcus llansteffanensis TaxID=2316731 RepID=A0A3A8PZD0_9BACT|nr:hypothetical protein [Corallococcus llansteffanensis]RKH59155.1 hypothetical protein D7V93_15455 [Corallococcus llansteffanensis]
MSNRFINACVAGTLGGLALRVLISVRNASLGRPPPYAARFIAQRLMGRVLQRELTPEEGRRWAWGFRAAYSPMLAVAWSLVGPAEERWSLIPRGLLLGLGVLAFEHLAFPVFKATEATRGWTLQEHAWLVAQTALYGVVTEAAIRALTPRSSRWVRAREALRLRSWA